jgi:hypothetical protein
MTTHQTLRFHDVSASAVQEFWAKHPKTSGTSCILIVGPEESYGGRF